MLTAEGNARSRNLLRRFGNVVEFPLQYLVVIVKSITCLSFRFLCGKYFACFKPLWKCLRVMMTSSRERHKGIIGRRHDLRLVAFQLCCTWRGFFADGIIRCLLYDDFLWPHILTATTGIYHALFPNIYLLSAEFSVRTVNYGPSFFSIDLWPKREVRGP